MCEYISTCVTVCVCVEMETQVLSSKCRQASYTQSEGERDSASGPSAAYANATPLLNGPTEIPIEKSAFPECHTIWLRDMDTHGHNAFVQYFQHNMS